MNDQIADFCPQKRNAVRAVILRDNMLLVQRKVNRGGNVRLTLPGGGSKTGETLQQSLHRECKEEIGADIEVHRLMHVADYFKKRRTNPPTVRHQIEFVFRCSVSDTYIASNGIRPDKNQQDVLWLDLDSQMVDLLWPDSWQRILQDDFAKAPVYLGLIDSR
ncbi:hypothetical protein K227x_23910 [Rubripirellula lacrimiformis]|uniref:Nudix hydrolase domain-containing protein n=1 Tax=Rubripirellula lacrimiformis TaxID=1930273 RepID=A0A517NA40_9BACT|nr:NUDIX domain-containing protein [Rubripirellula lacrimiformis]QDT04005.1 hypothetical protein K227x_23910 [Rubripirellula lacrimiformis]